MGHLPVGRSRGAVLDGRNGKMPKEYFGPRSPTSGGRLRDPRLEEHGFDFYGGGVHDIVVARNRFITAAELARTTMAGPAPRWESELSGDLRWERLAEHRKVETGREGCSPDRNYQTRPRHLRGRRQRANHQTTCSSRSHGAGRSTATRRVDSSRTTRDRQHTFMGRTPTARADHLATPTWASHREQHLPGPNEAAIYFENCGSRAVVRNNMIHRGVTRVGSSSRSDLSRNWENTDPGSRRRSR